MTHPDAKLKEEARGLLLSAQRLIEHGEAVPMNVILILPDGSKLDTFPLITDEASKHWAFSRLCQMARQLQAVAAILLYHGRSDSDDRPGTIAPEGWEKEGGARCLVVAVRFPGQESEWARIVWYEREGASVRWLPPEEFDFCVAPLLPDWWVGEAGHA